MGSFWQNLFRQRNIIFRPGKRLFLQKEKCPDLVLVPPNYDLYNRSSKALIKLLSEYTDKIEQYSIDEAFWI